MSNLNYKLEFEQLKKEFEDYKKQPIRKRMYEIGWNECLDEINKKIKEMDTISNCKIVNNPKIKLIRREVLLNKLKELGEK